MSKSTFDPATREGEDAIIVIHNSIIGGAVHGEPVRFDYVRPVRRFRVGQVENYAQYSRTVSLYFVPPGKRRWSGYRAYPDNLTYYTIESEAGVIYYDSRQDIPCAMAEFKANKQRFAKQWQDNGYVVIA